jgi:hypothetical protein
MNMHIGTKGYSPKTLGWKTPLGTSALGHKNTSNKAIAPGNNGIGLSSNHIMAAGHAPFQPVGLNKISNKTLNSQSGLEKR